MRRSKYIEVLSQLSELSTADCQQRMIYSDGRMPMLRLEYFNQVAKKHTELEDELWLRGFVTHFLGELIFSHGWMTVAIEIVEIALAVVTQQIDLALVVLVETYRVLDCITAAATSTAA